MSRYIDADALKEVCPCSYCDGCDDCRKEVEELPSIDIVRCGECRYCSLDVCVERTVSGKERCINICNRHSMEWVVNKEWFCADGERKESE